VNVLSPKYVEMKRIAFPSPAGGRDMRAAHCRQFVAQYPKCTGVMPIISFIYKKTVMKKIFEKKFKTAIGYVCTLKLKVNG
jgi:hypothetical protein